MRWTLLAVAYMAAIFALSSVPDDGGGVGSKILFPPPAIQNLLHVPVFAGLTWLWWRALRARGVAPQPAMLWAAVIAIAYGGLDEVHQMFVPGRFASVTDAALNAAGAGAVLAWLWLRSRAPPTPS